MSEYDPVFGDPGPASDAPAHDLELVRAAFARASRPYLSSPVPWLVWAVALPAAALATPRAAAAGGAAAVLLLWSGAILAGGAIEGIYLLRARRRLAASRLGSWAMTLQGNLSLVAALLSAALVWSERADLLPGLWLLLLGHSLFTLGGLAFRPQRTAGIVYQLGGVIALLPGAPALDVFAGATALGNLWMGLALVAQGRGQASGGTASSS